MMTSAFFLTLLLATQGNSETFAPEVDQVISAMAQRDADRRSESEGYTATRTYVLENEAHHKRAEMTVRITCGPDGTKQFEVLSSTGWGGALKHVFPRLLEAEASASRPGSGDDARLSPENYSFRMLGTEEIDGRLAYAVEVTPKVPKKYLIRGTIWIDAADYAVVRMQGSPAKNPSFFIKSVRFTHSYQKNGLFWLPASDVSLSNARIFGPTQLTIVYRDYQLGSAAVAAARQP